MWKRSVGVAAGLVTLLAGCAQTSVMDVNANTVMVSAAADPSCGRIGAKEVAVRRAAYETLRRGFDRYVILETAGEDNTKVVGNLPIEVETKVSGSVVDTTIDGGDAIMGGSYDQEIVVRMYRLSDPGADKAVDARRVLGPDWQKVMQKGPSEVC